MSVRSSRVLRSILPLVVLLSLSLACVGGDTRQVQESVNTTKADYENWLRTIGSLPGDTVGMPLIVEPVGGGTHDGETLVVRGWSVRATDRAGDPGAVARVRVYVMPDGYRTASAEAVHRFSEGLAIVDEETGEWELALGGDRLFRGATYIAARTEIDGLGSSGLARIALNVPRGRAVEDLSSEAGLPADTADSGFRPRVDGYDFRNGVDTHRRDDWEVWKLVCGGGPLAWFDFQLHDLANSGVFSGGLCFGFAASANTVWEGSNDVADFPGSADTVFGVAVNNTHQASGSVEYGHATPKVTREFIQRYYLSQFIGGVNSGITKGTEATYAHLKRVFERGDRDIPLLIIREKSFGGSGHAVTPFAISELAEGQAVVWVWDNNHPGQARPVYIDTGSWSWSYDLRREGEREGAPALTWSSEQGWMGYLSTSGLVEVMARTPGGAGIIPTDRPSAVERLLSPFTAVSITAEPLFVNESGERSGFVDGEAYDEIEGIDLFCPDIWSEPTTRLFLHLEEASYVRTVALGEEGEYTYAVSDESGIVRADVSGEAGSDTLGTDANGGVLEFAAGAERADVDLTIHRPVGETVRTMGTEDTALATGDTFTVAASEGDEGMVVSSVSSGERTYVPVFGVDDTSLLVAAAQTIADGETHTIIVEDWDALPASGVTLAIDRDSDGEVDDIVVLQEGGGQGGDGAPRFGSTRGTEIAALLLAAAALLVAGVAILVWPRRKRESM